MNPYQVIVQPNAGFMLGFATLKNLPALRLGKVGANAADVVRVPKDGDIAQLGKRLAEPSFVPPFWQLGDW
jgi:hypothetical protein